ncbi:acid phosphatase protein [Colletotrichum truncatum]|uniref:Acid phosphatase protein n=1 Tax=Colletotrichum truncatum TaxID=5467 RepID=A0ACC3ZCQ2_COLTU|nr:acid phosphatase protein [Colletotrichum truncatum]KAF6797866.1 acid phosphatase protein [Colletotrichum truncatum]
MASEKPEVPASEGHVEETSVRFSAQEHEPDQNKTIPDRVTSFFGDWYYVWEVFGILVSGLAIIAISVIISQFDHERVPEWTARAPFKKQRFHLSINSLLSILSVLGSTCAMIPVTKSLGQLKYLWFMEQDRKLADLEVFDSASRGKLGSAKLIWKLRFKHLAVLGGLASLLALAYGPFVQNMLITRITNLPSNHDALLSFSPSYFGGFPSTKGADSILMQSFYGAMIGSYTDWAFPPHECKTGECVWEEYDTLAACSHCTDISHLLTRTCTPKITTKDKLDDAVGCNVALPNGFSFDHVSLPASHNDSHRIVMAMNTTVPALVYNNYTDPLAFVQSIQGFPDKVSAFNASNEPDVYIITEDSILSAQECVIVPCIQRQNFNITRSVTSGTKNVVLRNTGDAVSVMKIINQWENYMFPSKTELRRRFVSIDYDDRSDKESRNKEQDWIDSFEIFLPSYEGMRGYLSDHFNGALVSSLDSPEFFETNNRSSVFSIFKLTMKNHSSTLYCGDEETTAVKEDGVVCAMNRIAAALTNGFRHELWHIGDLGQINGTTYEAQQICVAQWQYISAPIAVWALGLALFIGVVIKTRRANIKTWRTSQLATLLLRLDHDSHEHLKDWQHMRDAELLAVAQEVRLRLQVDENGPRFVRVNAKPVTESKV